MTYGPGKDVDETLKARSFNVASHIEEFDDVFAYREPSFRRMIVAHKDPVGGVFGRSSHEEETIRTNLQISRVRTAFSLESQ